MKAIKDWLICFINGYKKERKEIKMLRDDLQNELKNAKAAAEMILCGRSSRIG